MPTNVLLRTKHPKVAKSGCWTCCIAPSMLRQKYRVEAPSGPSLAEFFRQVFLLLEKKPVAGRETARIGSKSAVAGPLYHFYK
jgi:hypothetical protein